MPKKSEHEEIGQPVLFYRIMADRVAAMMAEIEAKQREVERIVAEEAKKNIIPPLIEVLEEEIEDQIKDQIESGRIQARLQAAHNALHGTTTTSNADNLANALREVGAARERMTRPISPTRCVRVRLYAEHQEALAEHYKHCDEVSSKMKSRAPCFLLRAQLDAAKKDAEWKIQSFKIIDALTQRVAALEARLDAKETVPIGTPVLGSTPDSDEDSCEGSEEPVRRTLFPYW